jgi:hypothetical protein
MALSFSTDLGNKCVLHGIIANHWPLYVGGGQDGIGLSIKFSTASGLNDGDGSASCITCSLSLKENTLWSCVAINIGTGFKWH